MEDVRVMEATCGGVKEFLQSSWRSLKLFVLMSLHDHLQEVELFHQPGLWTTLGFIFLPTTQKPLFHFKRCDKAFPFLTDLSFLVSNVSDHQTWFKITYINK